ncbi:Prefoldin subunit-domain-containing protein [Entophlyctis helioformis]|nr:Prefoldin subunit-domain-containing protein [Entophlyctis helioformis]
MATQGPLFVDPQVQRYESFVNDRLRKDLTDILDKRDKLYDRIAQLLQLRNQIEVMNTDKAGPELKTMMNVGSDFFIKARIPDTSKIIINVGADVFLEMPLDEAMSFTDRRVKRLEAQAEQFTEKAAEIRAHIKLVMQAIEDLMALGGSQGQRTQAAF